MPRLAWALSLIWCSAAIAQRADPVVWQAAAEPAVARPGEVVTLRLEARIEPPYHIYAAASTEGGMVPTSFSAAAGVETLGNLREDQPDEHFDEGFGVPVLTHQGTTVLRQPVRIPADAAPGKLALAGEVGYQACTDRSCLRPTSAPVSAEVTVEAGPVRAEFAAPEPETSWTVTAPAEAPATPSPAPTPVVNAADKARSHGLLTFLLAAFLAGFAALLTPCVFPMVPITVSFFTKQAGDNPRKRVGLAAAYGGGIVVMYSGLGLLLAITLGATSAQRLAANPFLNLAFAGLLVAFAMSLFGTFELQLPSGLVNLTSRQGDAGGYLGAMFMGLTLTLAAFTCTVQFVGGVLVWAANGERLWPVMGMLAFSTAFALPFFLLALFPQYLASLPKSGGWLESTKVVLGWIEIGAALKFVSNADLVWQWRIVTRELVLAGWVICALLATLYLWRYLPQGHGPVPDRLGHGRRWTGLMFLLLAGYFAWGLTGARLGTRVEALLPPGDYSRNPALQRGEMAWHEDLEAARAAARSAGGNVFLDFTGVTCTNCRWMEQNIFTAPAVAEALGKLTLARLYTDTGDHADVYQKLQTEKYQTASLPFYAIETPDGQTIATFDGLTRDAAAFAAFVETGDSH